jgi:hypothetical protein
LDRAFRHNLNGYTGPSLEFFEDMNEFAVPSLSSDRLGACQPL